MKTTSIAFNFSIKPRFLNEFTRVYFKIHINEYATSFGSDVEELGLKVRASSPSIVMSVVIIILIKINDVKLIITGTIFIARE